MHYYKKNIGDYHKKAGRLTMLQHGAYTLLMDSCYDREEFPTLEQALEWVWASTTEEVEAVKFVLSRFFKQEGEVYVQPRIMEELDKFKKNAETNKRIAIEREANRKKKRTNRAKTVNDSDTKQSETVNEAPPNHKPLTTNQEPLTSNQEEQGKSAKANPAFEIFKYWCEVMKKNPATTKLTPKREKAIKARLKDGYTTEQIKQAIDGCRLDPFSMGQNDRQKPFNDVELICRTGEKLESFLSGFAEPQQQQFSSVTQKNIQNTQGDW